MGNSTSAQTSLTINPNHTHHSNVLRDSVEFAVDTMVADVEITSIKQHLRAGKPSKEFMFLENEDMVEIDETTEAQKLYNREKNRYTNILPCDSTRVKLSAVAGVEGSDYINANFIDGEMNGTERAYIATQGPLMHTRCDFWRMVWENGCVTIVMLGKERENDRVKVDRYWPEPGLDGALTFGPFVVRAVGKEDDAGRGITVRRLELMHTPSGERRNVTHFQYEGWPDHGVPTSAAPIRHLIRLIEKDRGNLTDEYLNSLNNLQHTPRLAPGPNPLAFSTNTLTFSTNSLSHSTNSLNYSTNGYNPSGVYSPGLNYGVVGGGNYTGCLTQSIDGLNQLTHSTNGLNHSTGGLSHSTGGLNHSAHNIPPPQNYFHNNNNNPISYNPNNNNINNCNNCGSNNCCGNCNMNFNSGDKSPVVVHCSAGVGRTGTFCTIHMTLLRLHREMQKGAIARFNLYNTVLKLRRQRPGMVQQQEQYVFCYEAVAEEAEELGLLPCDGSMSNNSTPNTLTPTTPRSLASSLSSSIDGQ